MTTSIIAFRNKFTEGVLNFVWRQWCHMGVAGSVGRKDSWIIDPELALAFTTEVARHDARMFDEVLDWLVKNGQWINIQRVSTIVQQDNVGDRAVVGAIASWMTEHDKSMKWRGLAQKMISDTQTSRDPLFRTAAGKTITSDKDADAHFQRYGLVRETVHPRGMTQQVNTKNPMNIMFKCRAVFGIGMRADVMTYMVTTKGSHPRDIARTLGYNHMRVQEMLGDLAEAGIAFVRPVSGSKSKQYWIDRDKWRGVLIGEQASTPQWVNWRALIRGLTAIWREVWAIEEARADEYIFSSKMRSAMQSARNDLLSCGMGFMIEDDKGYLAEAYLPVFMRDMDNILKVLNE